MMTNATDSLLTISTSARAIAGIYSVALIATLVVAVVAVMALFTKRSSGEVRTLVWRSAVVALLVVFVGRQLPIQWIAWVVPSLLAGPLVALGRVQVTATSDSSHIVGLDGAAVSTNASAALVALLIVYAIGVAVVLAPTLLASIDARRRLRAARSVSAGWASTIAEVSRTLGVRRAVRVVVGRDAVVAMTWGFFRPVVVLPSAVETWSDAERRMVLLHELAHIRAGDWLFGIAARVVAALFWFHPGVWWIVGELRESCELACDERVISSGARRSDYAELLVRAADLLPGEQRGVALALARKRGLRARLFAVLDRDRVFHPMARGSAIAALTLTVGLAGPASVVHLAPTRGVLTTLMLDTQWESRAYAVLGLAQRADSVAVARDAAELDPSPRVRAWATYALGRQGSMAELRAIIREP
jgi:beta-lactamase regulating signal transducer with metallopeptidase domain